jgi:hypothetical protein
MLDQFLFFHPLPYVRRVIFIATPHRGSRVASGVAGRIFTGRIQTPADEAAVIAELRALNGPGVLRDENFGAASINALRELRLESPLLQAVSRLPVAPWVQYHTIAFQFAGHAPTDLLVPLWSAHLDGAASEAIFPGIHVSEQDPPALGEIRRILLEHMDGT